MKIKFRTELAVQPAPFDITYHTPLFFIGSCFSDNIARKLHRYKFPVLSNPFGTLYNPASVFHSLQIIAGEPVNPELFLTSSKQSFHYAFHSSVKAPTIDELQEKIHHLAQTAKKHLFNTRIAFITLGTAWYYTLKSKGFIVGNCHKQPQNIFVQQILSVEECTYYLQKIIHLLQKLMPKGIVVFTVSPVRYLQNGFRENTISKSVLHLAVQSLIDEKNIFYFPAYELILDDLRDYRFYADDLIHPSNFAINYVWNYFSEIFFSNSTKQTIKQIDKVISGIEHRAFSPESEENINRLKKLKKQVELLQREYPHQDWSEEIKKLNREITQ